MPQGCYKIQIREIRSIRGFRDSAPLVAVCNCHSAIKYFFYMQPFLKGNVYFK